MIDPKNYNHKKGGSLRITIIMVVLILSFMTNVVLGLKLNGTNQLLAEKSHNLTKTVESFSRQVNSYDSYCTYLENFIKANVPNAVWEERK